MSRWPYSVRDDWNGCASNYPILRSRDREVSPRAILSGWPRQKVGMHSPAPCGCKEWDYSRYTDRKPVTGQKRNNSCGMKLLEEEKQNADAKKKKYGGNPLRETGFFFHTGSGGRVSLHSWYESRDGGGTGNCRVVAEAAKRLRILETFHDSDLERVPRARGSSHPFGWWALEQTRVGTGWA